MDMNNWARGKGCRSMSHYVKIRERMRDHPGTSKAQREFEDRMKTVGLFRKFPYEDRIQRAELIEEIEAALGEMEQIHYSVGNSAEGYGSENPDGQRYADVLRKIYFQGKEINVITKEIGVGCEKIRYIRNRGLENLGRVLARRIR